MIAVIAGKQDEILSSMINEKKLLMIEYHKLKKIMAIKEIEKKELQERIIRAEEQQKKKSTPRPRQVPSDKPSDISKCWQVS